MRKKNSFLLIFALVLIISAYFTPLEIAITRPFSNMLANALSGEFLTGATETGVSMKDTEKGIIASGNDLFLSYEENLSSSSELLVFTNENTLLSSSPSYFADLRVLGAGAETEERKSIISYRAEKGDTLPEIAEKFNISENTIKWANDIKSGGIKEGDELLILPVTGVMYYVEKGDTISRIAEMHKAEAEDILSFNNIKEENIKAGDRLVIPDGEPLPAPSAPTVPQIAHSYFINPVPGGIITQGVHRYNAIDIGAACGAPIVAAASGRVTEIRRGTWPAGNFVKIDHGNVVILYAHMQRIDTSMGSYVSQGQQIGTVGSTGYSTGCHLHFDVLSLRIKNPFSHLPIGARP